MLTCSSLGASALVRMSSTQSRKQRSTRLLYIFKLGAQESKTVVLVNAYETALASIGLTPTKPQNNGQGRPYRVLGRRGDVVWCWCSLLPVWAWQLGPQIWVLHIVHLLIMEALGGKCTALHRCFLNASSSSWYETNSSLSPNPMHLKVAQWWCH